MNKKIKTLLVMDLILAIVFTFVVKNVNAIESSITIEEVQGIAGCYEAEKVEQKITEINGNEVTIELNLKNKTTIDGANEDTEIFFLIDDSGSMTARVPSGSTRKQEIVKSAIQLVNSIYEKTSTAKIGAIRFSKTASVIQNLTDNKSVILDRLNAEMNRTPSGSTDLTLGINSAKNRFSSTAKNKILIILTDGLPNNTTTARNALLSLPSSGIYSISMLIADSNNSTIQYVFGTESNPTTDKFYLINNADINRIISTDILTNVITNLERTINYTQLVEYFPDEITNNFDIEFIHNDKVEIVNEYGKNQKVIWNINGQQKDEDVSLKYKLILKDNFDRSIVNKVLDTTMKTEISYKYITTQETITNTTNETTTETEVNTSETMKYTLEDSTKIIIPMNEPEEKEQKETQVELEKTTTEGQTVTEKTTTEEQAEKEKTTQEEQAEKQETTTSEEQTKKEETTVKTESQQTQSSTTLAEQQNQETKQENINQENKKQDEEKNKEETKQDETLIKLEYITNTASKDETPKTEQVVDKTVATSTKLPQTGESSVIIVGIALAATSMMTFGALLLKTRVRR